MGLRSRVEAALATDRGFYYAVGLFTVAIFVVGLAILAWATPGGIGTRELVGFVVGFGLFMGSYVVAMVIYRSVPS